MCRVHTRCVILGSFTRGWSWENHLATLPLKCELGFESRSVSLCDEIMAGNGFREIHKPRELVFFLDRRCQLVAQILRRENRNMDFFFCSFLFCFVFNFRINEIRTFCRIDIRFISLLFGSLGQEKFFFFFFLFSHRFFARCHAMRYQTRRGQRLVISRGGYTQVLGQEYTHVDERACHLL